MKKLHTKTSTINGVGLYSTVNIKKGETVGYIHGEIVVFREFTPKISKQMLNWIGVGRYSWINTDDSVFRFINHSCQPNVAIVTKRKVIAIKDIPRNEELMMDYSFTEAEPDWNIPTCSCKSANCRGNITPITKLSKHTYQKNKPHITKNFQRVYETHNKNSGV